MFDTSLYIYICVKHFGMANIKKVCLNFLVCLYTLPKEELGWKKSLGYASLVCLAFAGHSPDLYRYCMVCRHLTSFTQFCWTNNTQTGLLSCSPSFFEPSYASYPCLCFFVSFLFCFYKEEAALPKPTHSVQIVNFIYVPKKWDVGAWTGLIWIRIETVGGVLCVR